MDHNRELGKVWRQDIVKWLRQRGALVFNPYEKPIKYCDGAAEDDESYRLIMEAKKQKDYDTVSTLSKQIRLYDLRACDEANALIVNLDWDSQPCGTFEEIFVSNRAKKPIIIYCPQGIQKISNWMFGVLPYEFFFENWEALKEYLRHIDEDENFDDLGRWRFFDFEEQIQEILKGENNVRYSM